MPVFFTPTLSPRFSAVAESALLLLSRIALATVFWQSGQTKIEGLAINLFSGQFDLGWPMIKESTFYLFQYEYQLPVIPYQWATYLATGAEHLLPLMLLFGLGTRFAALGLLAMTMTIQIFVYPDAYPTHLPWLALCFLLLLKGSGKISLERLFRAYSPNHA